MKHDPRAEEDEPDAPEGSGLASRLRLAVKAWKLRRIDAAVGFFQRWRERVEPAAEDDRHGRDDRRRTTRRSDGSLSLGSEAPAQPRRRHGILIVVALLLASGIAGMTFSYRLLSKAIESDDLIIDDLRDQVAQMEKAESRSVNIRAKDQQQLAESDKATHDCQATIQGYEDQVADLRKQVSDLTPQPRQAAGRSAAAPRREASQKTGNCVMGTANAVTDLTRCVDNFNRP